MWTARTRRNQLSPFYLHIELRTAAYRRHAHVIRMTMSELEARLDPPSSNESIDRRSSTSIMSKKYAPSATTNIVVVQDHTSIRIGRTYRRRLLQ